MTQKHINKLEHAYYAGFVRLWVTRDPEDTTKKEFARYIATKFGVDEEEFIEYQQLKQLDFELMDAEDREIYRGETTMLKKVFPQPDWAVDSVQRTDWLGVREDICKHGVGHPNAYWLEREIKLNRREGMTDRNKHLGTHGCDGCCGLKEDRPPTWDDDDDGL